MTTESQDPSQPAPPPAALGFDPAALRTKYCEERDDRIRPDGNEQSVRWGEGAARWILSTNRGDAPKARFVCRPNGPLHRPKLPGIPGVGTFRGHSFHLSRWDYAYTGGDSNGHLRSIEVSEQAELGERSRQNGFYGGGSEACFRLLREWRAAGALEGLELRSA